MTTKTDIEQLFKDHYPAMYRLAVLILRDEEVARDIVHDVFETILVRNLNTVSEAYLLKAVRNRCLSHIRHLSVRARVKEVYAIDEREIGEDDWPDDDTIRQIRNTIATDLSEACRRVVNLRFSEGMSYEEISYSLGISKIAVYKHLRHAIDVLRQKLNQNG